MTRRIALLTEIPAPYRIPLFNALAACTDIELEVLFLADRDPRRGYDVLSDEFRFRSRTLRGRGFVIGGRWLVLSRGTSRALAAAQPDVVVVGGWNQPAYWVAIAYARMRGLPLVTWVESTAADARSGGRLWERAKRAVVSASTAFLVPGRASEEYLRRLGAHAEIAVAPNAVDTAIFEQRVAVTRAQRDAVRRELGLTRTTALYVGRLAPEKGLDVLIEAAAGIDADIVLVGDGPERGRLTIAAPANVRFAGWLERDALVPWYAAADVFVLPSRSEPWGMVLNEAAAAGLPLVATAAAGAAAELVRDGENGFVVPPGDSDALRTALTTLAADPARRDAAGARSREFARRLRPEHWAEAVRELVTRL
jgi:glycosyltransferase involved in cell wall biosynthesis